MQVEFSTCDGYPLGAVSQRLHNPSMCLCCGLPGLLLSVNVEAVGDGRRTSIVLCERYATTAERGGVV